jgi:hypothetical protein
MNVRDEFVRFERATVDRVVLEDSTIVHAEAFIDLLGTDGLDRRESDLMFAMSKR